MCTILFYCNKISKRNFLYFFDIILRNNIFFYKIYSSDNFYSSKEYNRTETTIRDIGLYTAYTIHTHTYTKYIIYYA